MSDLLPIPMYFPLNDGPKYGLPKRSMCYDLLKARKLRAKRVGKLTMIEGQSVIEFYASAPDYTPGRPLNPAA